MSVKHPIIAITGSSGAGTTSVTRTFANIFRREGVHAAMVEGDSFHRYDRKERAAGEPQQTFSRLVRYALDGVFSFSYLPLRALTYAGMFVGSCGFVLGLYYVLKRLIAIVRRSVIAEGFLMVFP